VIDRGQSAAVVGARIVSTPSRQRCLDDVLVDVSREQDLVPEPPDQPDAAAHDALALILSFAFISVFGTLSEGPDPPSQPTKPQVRSTFPVIQGSRDAATTAAVQHSFNVREKTCLGAVKSGRHQVAPAHCCAGAPSESVR
jgi:hypothetical protein